jgi:hypothetical protein
VQKKNYFVEKEQRKSFCIGSCRDRTGDLVRVKDT